MQVRPSSTSELEWAPTLVELAWLGYSVLCVELDRGLRARLTKDGFDTATDLEGVADQSQRAVYSFNVLEHIEQDQAILHELFRVTAPGGRLLLYVPAFPILFSAMDLHVGHHRRYRRDELVKRAKSAGFEIDSCVYADSLGFPAAFVYKVVRRGRGGVLSARSVRYYDRLIFPISRRCDSFLHVWFGKNLVLTAHRLGAT